MSPPGRRGQNFLASYRLNGPISDAFSKVLKCK